MFEGVRLTILGEPASAKNQRRIVFRRGRHPLLIKSAKALSYADAFNLQVKKLPELIAGPVALDVKVWYASMRPDIDITLIKDLLQGKVIINDRQITRETIVRYLDRTNPRAELHIYPVDITWDPGLAAAMENGHQPSDPGRVPRKAKRKARGHKVARHR